MAGSNEGATTVKGFFLNIFLMIGVGIAIFIANYLIYFYVIVPFGIIYKLDKTTMKIILGSFILFSIIAFIIVLRKENMFNLGDLGLKNISTKPTNINVEISVLFTSLEQQVKFENVGTFDQLHMELYDLINQCHSNKRMKYVKKLKRLKEEIDRIKKKYNVA